MLSVEQTTPFFLGVRRDDGKIVQMYFGDSQHGFFSTPEAARQYRDHVFAENREMIERLGVYRTSRMEAEKVE